MSHSYTETRSGKGYCEDRDGFIAHNHKEEKIARVSLLPLNGISHEENLENLLLLLSDVDRYATKLIASLPTNEDVLRELNGQRHTQTLAKVHKKQNFNEMCIVILQDTNAKYEWYIGYIKGITVAGYIVDHLHRAISNSDTKWKYPKTKGTQSAEESQIVSCDEWGDWDISPDSRKRLFTLYNIQQAQASVQEEF